MSASGSFWEKVMTWRAARLGGGQHPAGVFAVQIDAPHLRLGEDPQLGGEVVLKVGVLDGGDVVQADVQEAGGGEAGAQGAVVLQRLAGHLHGEVGDAGRHRVGKVPLEIQGSGVVRWDSKRSEPS